MNCSDDQQIKLTLEGLKAIDDYEEYRRIVGEDDGGKIFTPQQYEEYKKKYIPIVSSSSYDNNAANKKPNIRLMGKPQRH
ncbi:hypothetical protein D915_003508 [Fasciola hepatica]|uniref:Uncharacterized protein n=1 Tax=Fasciola hepatica TaxID=6192 RepID=A0A2H1CIN0_FASHE|nr:hypothetical protein D915_003508 [Fasciola hepatica]